MPFKDEDFLYGVIDVVECAGELRFTHEPGCTCSAESATPAAVTTPPSEGDIPF
jgi:hypothetical protein